jgi:hypothetical protein
MTTNTDIIDITFVLYIAPETRNTFPMSYVGNRYKAYEKAALVTKNLYNFLRTNPDCSITDETTDGFIVSGPRYKLSRFLNND